MAIGAEPTNGLSTPGGTVVRGVTRFSTGGLRPGMVAGRGVAAGGGGTTGGGVEFTANRGVATGTGVGVERSASTVGVERPPGVARPPLGVAAVATVTGIGVAIGTCGMAP